MRRASVRVPNACSSVFGGVCRGGKDGRTSSFSVAHEPVCLYERKSCWDVGPAFRSLTDQRRVGRPTALVWVMSLIIIRHGVIERSSRSAELCVCVGGAEARRCCEE